MIDFGFVSDDQFRAALEADWQELENCRAASSWKAIHVLAGSIIEAILIDYLGTETVLTQVPANELLQLDLNKLVELCRKHKLLSENATNLSTVVRSYRNLIHPGRMVRLKEVVDENSASIARSLVAMVVSEIQKRRRKQRGYTASQILSKLLDDSSSLSILSHLLSQDVSKPELDRLVLNTLPDAYWQAMQDPDGEPHQLRCLANAYRIAFDTADETTKIDATRRVVAVLKEENGQKVSMYEEVFLRAAYLVHLTEADRAIVKAHLLAELKSPSVAILRTCMGLVGFLNANELSQFLTLALAAVANDRPVGVSKAASDLLLNSFLDASSDCSNKIKTVTAQWVTHYRNRGATQVVDRFSNLCRDVLGEVVDDIPF